ncbi:TIGR02594 family protein [Brevundimonas sp.]|uniref:TIGR02594 family protein n=1 Tax=Brevundimonas sp. TaxID=1871086 RepID=UPI002FCC1EDC
MLEPAWLKLARAQVGTREIVGPKHSPVIMAWIQEIGAKALGVKVNDDETPWCGTFMAWLMKRCGLSTPAIAVRAASWGRAGSWGRELLGPRLGCVLVFTRAGGGHVGLYLGEDATHFHVLGGNQSNSVSVTRIAKNRLAVGGMRWPKGPDLPPAQIIRLKPSGAPITTNEA